MLGIRTHHAGGCSSWRTKSEEREKWPRRRRGQVAHARDGAAACSRLVPVVPDASAVEPIHQHLPRQKEFVSRAALVLYFPEEKKESRKRFNSYQGLCALSAVSAVARLGRLFLEKVTRDLVLACLTAKESLGRGQALVRPAGEHAHVAHGDCRECHV